MFITKLILKLRRSPKPRNHDESVLLQQPVDIILSIVGQLPLESVAAFGLACKALSHLMLEKACVQLAHDSAARQLFLQLLEKELAERYYYCYDCNKLHSYHPSWKLSIHQKSLMPMADPGMTRLYHCYSNHRTSFLDTSIQLSYRHIRLLTNRHLFGPPSGLPLGILNIAINFGAWESATTQWEVRWTGQIINDELFLSGKHRLLCRRGTTAKKIREGLDTWHHSICPHIGTNLSGIPDRRIPFFEQQPDSDPLSPCQERVVSCGWCLTDCDVTIKWIDQNERPGTWYIVVQSYHQIGRGRSPWDWKWVSYQGKFAHSRDFSRSGVGAVRDRWMRSE